MADFKCKKCKILHREHSIDGGCIPGCDGELVEINDEGLTVENYRDDRSDNEQRYMWAREALEKYRAVKGTDCFEADTVDLITDLLHYAIANGYDSESIIGMATSHIEAES